METLLSLWEFPRVVGGLLKTTSSASPGPNGRIINSSAGLHHLVKTENSRTLLKLQKKCQGCGVRLHPMCFSDYNK